MFRADESIAFDRLTHRVLPPATCQTRRNERTFLAVGFLSRLARPQHSQRESPSVLEWLNGGDNFRHGIPHGRQSVALVGLREELIQRRPRIAT